MDTFPLAESIFWRGKLLPRYAWYMLSGAVCDVAQFITYKMLCSSLASPTLAWTAAYMISIAMRQESHKVFVFGHYEGKWWQNLWRFYCVYFTTVLTSMPVNLALVRAMALLPREVLALGIAHTTYAYFGTTIYTGLFSYVRLKANWRKPSSPMKLSRSGLDLGVLPTGAPPGAPGAFNKFHSHNGELSRRGLGHHVTNPCAAPAAARHKRVPSCGSEYSKLITI